MQRIALALVWWTSLASTVACGSEPSPGGAPGVSGGAPVLALTGVRWVDLTGAGSVSEPMTVVLRPGAVVAAGPVAPPTGAVVVADGGYLLPGLIDLHVHLDDGAYRSDADPIDVLRTSLAFGVTTVFSTALDPEAYRKVRAATRAAPADLPRFFGTDKIFGARDGWGGWDYTPATIDEVERDVAELRSRGVDTLKLVYDDMAWINAEPMPLMREDILRAVVAAGRRAGLRVVAHAPQLTMAKTALRAGVDGLVHGIVDQPVDAELIALLRERDRFVVSTLTIYENTADLNHLARRQQALDAVGRMPPALIAELLLPETVADYRRAYPRFAYVAERLPVAQSNLKELVRAGIRVVMGTDSGISWVVAGIASQLEVVLLHEAGLTAAEALRAATVIPGLVLGDPPPSLSPGARADFVLLAENPLEDVTAVSGVVAVVRDGRLHRPAQLLATR